ncbi:MAG: hypothetical protein KUG64_11315, partial [Cycloclasticus sp.]|nr:hypothetical protein [Cycloclasticus sp.]
SAASDVYKRQTYKGNLLLTTGVLSVPLVTSTTNGSMYAVDKVFVDAIKMPDPFYLAWGGQSNAVGSDGGSGTNWITETDKVYAFVVSSGLWVDASTLQGSLPFNTDSSNCAAVHAALDIANTHGITVRIVMATNGSTELEQWTGGGYASGSPIATDRTVSGSNRVEFKKWTDAITTAGIDQFDGFGWWHGEADLDTPEATYLTELAYLYSDLKTRGNAPVGTRKFPMVVFGLYTGVNSGQQANRNTTMQKFARLNPDEVSYVTTDELAGYDSDLGDPDNVINHFSSESYKTAGERGGVALRGAWYGNSFVADDRLTDIMLPASGLLGEKLGTRSHNISDISGVIGTITGATQADPCVITATGHSHTTGDKVKIESVVGMTELNDIIYTITVIDPNSFSLDGIDSTAFTAYSSAGTSETALDLSLDSNNLLGETYTLDGTVTVNLDPTANQALGDEGRGVWFTTLSNSDVITFVSDDGDGTTRNIQQMGEAGTTAELALTGAAGRGLIVYEGSRYVIHFWPRLEHATAVIQTGTNTSRRMYNPAELRVAGVAAVDALKSTSTISTDAGVTMTLPVTTVFHTGTLTGTRTANIANTGAVDGDVVRIARSGSGAFNLAVRDQVSAGLLKNLATGEWMTAAFDGTNWILTGFGSL